MSQQTVLTIAGMSCQHCVRAVDEALRAVPGVVVEKVEIGSAVLSHTEADGHAATEAALVAVTDAGYAPSVSDRAS